MKQNRTLGKERKAVQLLTAVSNLLDEPYKLVPIIEELIFMPSSYTSSSY